MVDEITFNILFFSKLILSTQEHNSQMDTDYQVIFLISALIPEYLIFNEHLVCEYKYISINVEQIGFALIL